MEKKINEPDSQSPCRQSKKSFDISGGLFLVFLGIIFLLNNFNLLPWNVWSQLWKFWPVFIITAGINHLLGKSVVSKILIFFISLAIIILVSYFTLPIKSNDFNLLNLKSNIEKNLNTNINTQKYEVSNFNKLSLEIPGALTLQKGDTNTITIEAPQNILENIKVEVQNNSLVIKYDNLWNNSWFNSNNIIINVTTTNSLDSYNIAGSGNIIIKEIVETDSLDLNIAGSGKIQLETITNNLTSKIAGSGAITIKGQSVNHQITINGSGDIFAQNLESQNTKINIAGSGNSEINSTQTLDITISGSGSVIYTGNPNINQSVIGSGSIKQRQ